MGTVALCSAVISPTVAENTRGHFLPASASTFFTGTGRVGYGFQTSPKAATKAKAKRSLGLGNNADNATPDSAASGSIVCTQRTLFWGIPSGKARQSMSVLVFPGGGGGGDPSVLDTNYPPN